MEKKHLITLVAVAVVFAAGGFFGGTKYAQVHAKNNQPGIRQGNSMFGRRNGQNSGFTGGQIISKDDKSVTIKTMDGGSRIVFFGSSTQIGKTVSGVISDLNSGDNIVVTGTANSDGSITAQNIQIRPTLPQQQQPSQAQ